MGKGAGPLFEGSQIDEDGHLAAIDEDAPPGFPSIASGENERSNKDDDASPYLLAKSETPEGTIQTNRERAHHLWVLPSANDASPFKHVLCTTDTASSKTTFKLTKIFESTGRVCFGFDEVAAAMFSQFEKEAETLAFDIPFDDAR